MDSDNQKQDSHKQAPRGFKREDSNAPKNGNADNLPYRITGLEKAKLEPGMTADDIAALDRVIAKLKEKLAYQTGPKPASEE